MGQSEIVKTEQEASQPTQDEKSNLLLKAALLLSCGHFDLENLTRKHKPNFIYLFNKNMSKPE